MWNTSTAPAITILNESKKNMNGTTKEYNKTPKQPSNELILRKTMNDATGEKKLFNQLINDLPEPSLSKYHFLLNTSKQND